jgi:hypothetical protein
MSGTFGNFGQSGAPGFVDPFALNAIGLGAGLSQQTMQNRYEQLGMAGSTPEQMDLGILPSVSGGIPGQFSSITGQLQNNNLAPAGVQNAASQAGTILSAFSK